MKKQALIFPTLLGTCLLSLSLGQISTAAPFPPPPDTAQASEQIYGSQLMTDQERLEYRERMRTTQTAEERERIRQEHHLSMQERAKAQGLTLPDAPPAMGKGMGVGGGMGPGGGMGAGGGMGPGRGMGPGGGMGQGRGGR